MLDSLGYQDVHHASNGKEAIAAVAMREYDVILMDCQMPELDGYRATQEIRRREGDAQRMPILAMTASVLQADRERALQAGMDDYVPKPLHKADLAHALDKWTAVAAERRAVVQRATLPSPSGIRRSSRAPGEAAVGSAAVDSAGAESGQVEPKQRDAARVDNTHQGGTIPPPHSFPLLSRSALDELRQLGGEALVGEICHDFLERIDAEVRALESRREHDDLAGVRAKAHAMKSASRYVGALRLAEQCAEIERAARDDESPRAFDLVTTVREIAEESEAALRQALSGEVGT